MHVHCAAAVRAMLGEGALWDAGRGILWWVDIQSSRLHGHHVASGINTAQDLEFRLTALGLCDGGGLIACGDRGFVRLSVAEDLRVSLSEVIAAPDEPPGNRFNDGKTDGRGRFWAGTMDDSEQVAQGSLYRLDGSGRIRRIRTGLKVPNGPCFLADGTMLTTDTPTRIVSALQLDETGEPVAERRFAHFGAEQGYPDGMTVDAEDHVWIAFWDGWCVRRLSPDGRIVAEFPLPVQRPTCPAFGGDDLRQLFITTASTGLSPEALESQPLAGSLLRIDPGVVGRAPSRFAG